MSDRVPLKITRLTEAQQPDTGPWEVAEGPVLSSAPPTLVVHRDGCECPLCEWEAKLIRGITITRKP